MSQIVTALREVIAERERLQAELAAMRETADATVAANIKLAGERDLARQQVDELMAEREVAAQAAKERAAAFDALQAQATALEATVAEKDGQNTELRDLIAKSNQQVAVLQLERDTLQSEVTGLRVELKDAQALAETIRQESRAEIKAVEDKAKAELEATVATALDDMEKAQTVEKDLKAELLALTADREQTLTFLRTVQDDVLAKASEIEALKQEVTEARAQAESEVAARKAATLVGWQLTEQLQTAKENYEGLILQQEQSIQQLQNSLALLRGEQGQMAELLGVQIGAPAQ